MYEHMDLDFLGSDLVYLLYSYMFLISWLLMTGSVSVLASYVFVTNIYAGIRSD